jgi:thiamine pyrophosphokinase
MTPTKKKIRSKSGRAAVIFTHGNYLGKDLPFYKNLCRGRTTIAADGGMQFFQKAKLRPDLLIGDLDSLPKNSLRLVAQTAVMKYPVEKNETDLHAALAFCLLHQAQEIIVVIPEYGQPDHFIASIMLTHVVSGVKKNRNLPALRFVNPDYEIHFLKNSRLSIAQQKGKTLSVVPLSSSITLTTNGTAYDVRKARIRLGHTRALRNTITRQKATISMSGEALVILITS